MYLEYLIKMRRLYVLTMLFLILITSCKKSKESRISQSSISGKTENFDDFFKKFKTNMDFQKSRLSSDLFIETFEEKDTVKIKCEDFKFIYGETDIEGRQIFYRIDKKSSKEIIVIITEENGVNVEHNFKLRNGKWFLYKIVDYSN